jgi:uncharacterized membrane protein YebE (DUF533 family)
MKDLNKMISGLSKSGFMSGMAGGALSGVVTNLAMGKSSKKAKKMGKSALKVGALAAVGGLAWKAYQTYNDQKSNSQKGSQQNVAAQTPQQAASPSYIYTPQQQAPAQQHTYSNPAGRTFDYNQGNQNRFEQIIEDETGESGQLLLLQAMIAAAYADGHIDANEQQRIYNRVENLELSVEEKASLFDELRNPKSLEQIVTKVPDAETGIEVYAASLLAIDESQTISQDYLNQLAMRLMIPSELRASIHSQANQARLS